MVAAVDYLVHAAFLREVNLYYLLLLLVAQPPERHVLHEDILVLGQLQHFIEDSVEGGGVVVDGQIVEGLDDAGQLVDVHSLPRGH